MTEYLVAAGLESSTQMAEKHIGTQTIKHHVYASFSVGNVSDDMECLFLEFEVVVIQEAALFLSCVAETFWSECLLLQPSPAQFAHDFSLKLSRTLVEHVLDGPQRIQGQSLL